MWFRGGLVFKAHRLSYHSTLGSRLIRLETNEEEVNSRLETLGSRLMKKKKKGALTCGCQGRPQRCRL